MRTMTKHYPLIWGLSALVWAGCHSSQSQDFVASNFAYAEKQLDFAFSEIEKAKSQESQESKEERTVKGWGELVSPRNTEPDGTLHLVPSKDWTSGFFPGELWYLYEYTGKPYWREKAERQTNLLEREKKNGSTHDMGFKMYCSYGNGYRLTGKQTYRDILIESAYTLAGRFKPRVGCIRSWDHHADQWECPVIIDNMLNLELLFWAFRATNDSTFYQIAVKHARTTMANHFRDDYSTYHVVNYDTLTGKPLCKVTHQGYSDSSAWARGQAWALYGYTLCYRETGLPEFLKQAKHVEHFLFTHPNMPDDLIPYWDFDAPDIPNEPRDVSAAACIASALYELSTYVIDGQQKKFKQEADCIVQNLSEHYRAKCHADRGFLLLHSTGSKPHDSEVDVPLVYADYYFLEALLRKSKIEKGEKL